MPDLRPASRRRPVAVGAAALLLLLAGCTGDGSDPDSEPTEGSTPLADYALRGVALARTPFCDRISAIGVVGALDGTAQDATTWGNGEPVRLAGGKDVAHEFGCRYTREGAAAETWLFAPPVTPARAEELTAQARTTDGCRAEDDVPAFGKPSVALVCEDGGETTASYRGLFGDAWLTCAVTRDGQSPDGQSPDELVGLAGKWCVQVVEAARVR